MLSLKNRHIPQIALILIITALHIPVILSHQNYLLTWFNTDDAFYYFKTAQNIIEGRGITFDGIGRTNGFHPLWLLIISPLFALARYDLVLPLRLVTILLVLFNIGSALLLYHLTSRHLAPGVAFLTALSFALLPAIHGTTTKGGMESGLNTFFIILLLSYLNKRDGRTLILSGIAALTFLVRLDNIFLVYLAGGWLLIRNWNPPSDKQNVAPWSHRIRLTLFYFVPLTILIIAYILWNQIGFGTPIPVSGQVKQWWGTLNNTVYGFPPKHLISFVGQFLTDDENIGPWSIITRPLYIGAENIIALLGMTVTINLRHIALAVIGLLTTGVGGLLVVRQRKLFQQAILDFGLIPLFLGCLFQITYYNTTGSVGERPWYWVGEMLFVVLCGGILLESMKRLDIGDWRLKISNLQSPIPNICSLLASVTLLLITFSLILPHLPRIGKILSPDIASQQSFYLRRADWLETNTEPNSVIGMTGTGTSAYFTQGRTLINLDGLISSYEYFQHMQNGTAHKYLSEIGLDYVFGNQYIVQESDPYKVIFENRLEHSASFHDERKTLFLWQFEP